MILAGINFRERPKIREIRKSFYKVLKMKEKATKSLKKVKNFFSKK